MAASAPGHAACPLGRQPPRRVRVPACKHRRHPALEPFSGVLLTEGRLDRRGRAAPGDRPAPPAADLIVHPLRPSRATALPDGGEAEVSPPGGDQNRRRTGEANADGNAEAGERTMLRGETVDTDGPPGWVAYSALHCGLEAATPHTLPRKYCTHGHDFPDRAPRRGGRRVCGLRHPNTNDPSSGR